MLHLTTLITATSAISINCLRYNKNDCRNFELVKVPSDGIENAMVVGNSTNVPEGLKDFHGLWYMNGNDMPDEVMSFGASYLNRNGKDWSMKVYDEKVWSFSPYLKGRALYHAARHNGFTYKIVKESEDAYRLQPEYHLPAYLFSVKIPISRFIAQFIIRRTEDPNIWISTGSWFQTSGHSYKLTRIVDGQGSRTPKYSTDYLSNLNNPQDQKNVELRREQLIAVIKGSEKIKKVLSAEKATVTTTEDVFFDASTDFETFLTSKPTAIATSR